MRQNSTYGLFVKQRRKELGLSQGKVAKYLSCTPQAVSRYENGQVNIPLALLPNLCKALELSIDSFIEEDPVTAQYEEDVVPIDSKKLAKSLVFLRQKKHETLQEEATELNISVSRLSGFEAGKMLPSLEEFRILADSFGVSYHDLYYNVFDGNEVASDDKEEKGRGIHMNPLLPWLIALSLAVLVLSLIMPFSFTHRKPKGQNTNPIDPITTPIAEDGKKEQEDQPLPATTDKKSEEKSEENNKEKSVLQQQKAKTAKEYVRGNLYVETMEPFQCLIYHDEAGSTDYGKSCSLYTIPKNRQVSIKLNCLGKKLEMEISADSDGTSYHLYDKDVVQCCFDKDFDVRVFDPYTETEEEKSTEEVSTQEEKENDDATESVTGALISNTSLAFVNLSNDVEDDPLCGVKYPCDASTDYQVSVPKNQPVLIILYPKDSELYSHHFTLTFKTSDGITHELHDYDKAHNMRFDQDFTMYLSDTSAKNETEDSTADA